MLKIPVKCLDLDQTLDCGQCFRWKKEKDNSWIGIIQDRVVKLKIEKEILYVSSNKEEELEKVIKEYLDLERDYESIEKEISKIDENIEKAVRYTSGIRILNQSKFETIISFIISANNNIPRITKSIDLISAKYGQKVIFEGKEYNLFPSVENLLKAEIEDLRNLGVGFRDKYIYSSVRMLSGEMNLDEISKLSDETLKKELIKLSGVGPKVADCIMLFSFSRMKSFPIDTWIKKVMQRLYYNDCEVQNNKILQDSLNRYGKYTGIVQQHLFQAVRKNLV